MPTLKLPGKGDRAYWDLIAQWARDYRSDGCTMSPDWWLETCQEHDYHWRYGQTLFGDPISFQASNLRFRRAIQERSKLRWFNPISWERYYAVSSPIGRRIWDEHRRRNLRPPIL